ncbi:MAG: hypothetical protein EZS28_023122 [Streblomastix strix]|uniref:Uncharacterized protein n=1 Tax=Streblomastix strix TaxID=222440 RepID=A0A5J4VFJ2_9EUKA|nr:MAG: hypothetical protein EZS28_023122 [Streblomastix strix]
MTKIKLDEETEIVEEVNIGIEDVYDETLPHGPLSTDPLLFYGVYHLKISERDVNKCQGEERILPTFEQTSYSSYAVSYSARNRYLAGRVRNQSIFDRPRDTVSLRRNFKVATAYAKNERASRSLRGR